MRLVKIAGLASVLALIAGCKTDKPNKCSSDEQCSEGAYCDTEREVCFQACEKVGCLDGHYCDPSTQGCTADCPFTDCPAPPSNATAKCEAACGYICRPGFHDDGVGGCAVCDKVQYCGKSCAPCPAPENGAAACNDGECGVLCDAEHYDAGGTCAACDLATHCGPSCAPCASGESCDGGTTCVASTAPPRFVRNITTVPDQPTVSDTTGLIWQGCAAGLSGSDCGSGGATLMTWEAAKTYCNTTLNAQNWGGYNTGWRLPTQSSTTVGELSSLLIPPCQHADGSMCIDNASFPGTPGEWFSTGSVFTGSPDSAWVVHFYYGNVSGLSINGSRAVRCVRNQ